MAVVNKPSKIQHLKHPGTSIFYFFSIHIIFIQMVKQYAEMNPGMQVCIVISLIILSL